MLRPRLHGGEGETKDISQVQAALYMKQSRRVAAQDEVAVRCRQIQLLDKRIRVFDCLIRAESVVRTNYHAVGAHKAYQKSQRFRIESDGVVVKSPDVLPERALQFELVPFQAMPKPACKIREAAA